MPDNSNIPNSDLVTYSVKIDGKELAETVEVIAISIDQSVDAIAKAELVVSDNDPSGESFEQSSSSNFVPGNKVSIAIGYNSENNTVFQGIITRQSLKVGNTGTILLVECQDEAVKMTVGRKSKTYENQKDSSIMESIITGYGGLSADVSDTRTILPRQVQYYVSDWDYLVSRAQANGKLISAINGKVSVKNYDKDTSSVLIATYGDNVLAFESELNSTTQLSHVNASTWDFNTQSVISGEAKNTYAGVGNISSSELAKVVGLDSYQVQTSGYLNSDELTTWSKAQMVRSELSKITGSVKIQGSSAVLPTNFITLDGFGDRFSGVVFVSAVQHTVLDGNWLTKITFGMSPEWKTEETDVMAPPAAGLLPGIRGLYNATVKQIYDDPDRQFRIQIDVPLLDHSGRAIWARLSNFYSTSGAGAFFLPEVGDEVIVGFLNEDPRFPVILGSLYSGNKNKPYDTLSPNETNGKKAIVTKSKLQIEFDDDQKILTILTPNKNTISLNDEGRQIKIEDQSGNSIVMSESGISLKSPADINIQSDQTVNIKGTTGVNLTSDAGDVVTKGMNIKNSADMELNLESSMTATLKSGTQMTLQSAMIMIN